MGFIDGIPGNLNNISMPSMGSDVDPFKRRCRFSTISPSLQYPRRPTCSNPSQTELSHSSSPELVEFTFENSQKGQFTLPWEDKPKAVRPAPLTVQQWRDCFDDATGRLKGGGETAIGRVRLGGCDAEIRAEVWPFLLGLYEAGSTEAERAQLRAQRRVLYEEIRAIAARVAVIARQAEEEATRRMKEEEEREEREEREREARERKEREEREREEREEREGEESERGRSNEGGSSQEEVRSSGRGSGNGDANGSNGGENSGVGNASDDEFSDAVCVDSACASLSVSTESFVDVAQAMEAAAAAGLPEHGHLSPPQRLHAARLVAILEAYAVYDPELDVWELMHCARQLAARLPCVGAHALRAPTSSSPAVGHGSFHGAGAVLRGARRGAAAVQLFVGAAGRVGAHALCSPCSPAVRGWGVCQVLCCEGLVKALLLCNTLSGQLDVWELMHCARQLAARLP
ncbi:unnamed protein product [Closterium sp. Yama58-4]|nr:unnamed protein product [Closterium sp. Yama58-4]